MSTSFSFGKFLIPHSHVFLSSSFAFSFVNLRPVVPGHVLVSPMRTVAKYSDLSDHEAQEIWLMTQKVAILLESIYKKPCEICIQDGSAAGQTVEHLHIHVVPKIESRELIPMDSGRKDRTTQEMSEEAGVYRNLLK